MHSFISSLRRPTRVRRAKLAYLTYPFVIICIHRFRPTQLGRDQRGDRLVATGFGAGGTSRSSRVAPRNHRPTGRAALRRVPLDRLGVGHSSDHNNAEANRARDRRSLRHPRRRPGRRRPRRDRSPAAGAGPLPWKASRRCRSPSGGGSRAGGGA